MTRAVRRAGAIAVALTTACSLTAFPDLTSGNGTNPSPTKDGSGDAASVPDQSAAPVDASTTGFCRDLTPKPFFCDDFDDVDDDADIVSRWGLVHRFNGSYGVSYSTVAPRSLPRSIVSRIDPGSEDCAYATLEQVAEGSYARAEVGFSGRLAKASDLTTSADVLAMVSFGQGDERCQFYFAATPTTIGVGEQIVHPSAPREEKTHDIAGALPVGTWARIVLAYDAKAKKISVTIDGATVLDMPAELSCPYTPTKAIGTVGLFCGPQRATSRVYEYDDVTFDAR